MLATPASGDSGNGYLFCNHYTDRRKNTVATDSDKTPQVVLIIPAFGEEMNYSRQILQHFQTQALEQGIDSYQPDLFATGDSDGELQDASWQHWIDDIHTCLQHLLTLGYQRIHILALRLGARLWLESIRQLSAGTRQQLNASPGHYLLWQPLWQAMECLQPMIRAQVIAAEMRGTKSTHPKKPTQQGFIHKLQQGTPIEIGGYPLHAPLGRELAIQKDSDDVLDDLFRVDVFNQQYPNNGESADPARTLHWIEMLSPISGKANPARQLLVERYNQTIGPDRYKRHYHSLVCDPFWQTPGIQHIPSLIQLSIRLLT